jgi:hypothetical protein
LGVLKSYDQRFKRRVIKAGISQIRSNIERIISSYRHIWDIIQSYYKIVQMQLLSNLGEENIVKVKLT